MSYLRFSQINFLKRILFFYCAIIVTQMFPIAAHSAEWRECEKAKLREIKLQQGAASSKPTKGKKSKKESRSERIEEIDTWLWKNCREFSYELRQLEQNHM